MTSRSIEHIEMAIASIHQLQNNAASSVERVDLVDIKSDLDTALEKLQVLQNYQESSGTDYDELWKTRKQELHDFEKNRDAWIRTQIFTKLLKNII